MVGNAGDARKGRYPPFPPRDATALTYRNNQVAVLTAAYNEGTQIGQVLKTVPEYVDHIVVVNDASTDHTVEVVSRTVSEDDRIVLIDLPQNVARHAYQWGQRRRR